MSRQDFRQHFPEHAEAFAEFRALCVDAKFRDAQLLLLSGGGYRPVLGRLVNREADARPALDDFPTGGGFFLYPEDLDDPVFNGFLSWMRRGVPYPAPLQFYDSLRVQFHSNGVAKRSWS